MRRPLQSVLSAAMAVVLVLVLVVVLVLLPLDATAQGSYRSVPVGGRSALMGNTGVAQARDGAAPFLNPATIVGITDEQIAFSVNVYSATFTTLRNLHAPRSGDGTLTPASLSDARLDAIPSTFCLFLTLSAAGIRGEEPDPKSKLALCAGTSERRVLSASASASGLGPDGRPTVHLASLERSYGRLHVGPTYGRKIGDTLALGASLHLVDTRATSLTTADGPTSAFSSSTVATSFDLALLVGATLAIDRSTTLGLSFGLPSVHVASTLDAADHSQQSSGGDLARTRAGSGGAFSAPLPPRIAVGLGTRTKRWRIEADATYFFAVDEAFRSELTARSVTVTRGGSIDQTDPANATTRAGAVLDSAVGAELFVSDSISLLGGFATDFGATPRLTAAPALGTVATTRENRVIASFGVGSYGTGSELLFGAQLEAARGETLVGDSYSRPSELAPAPQHSTTVLFIVAGSTSLSTLRRTFEDLRHTIPIR